MIFHDAMQSLKEDFSRTFIYFMTFFFTTMFMFVFFNMAESEMAVSTDFVFTTLEANVSDYIRYGDIANIMMVIVLVLSVVDIVFANRFFVRNKAEELAVRLVCGATFTQMAFYLLAQTFVLLLIAIPLGICCGMAFLPLLNTILHTYIDSAFTITIQSKAIAQFTVIIVFIIVWTTMLNLSYIYQNEAAKILNGQGDETDKNGSPVGGVFARIPNRVKAVVGLFCYMYPLYGFYTSTDSMALYGMIGMIGLDMMIRFIVDPWLTYRIKKKDLKNPVQAATLGFLREDVMKMRVTIYLFVASAIILMGMLVLRMDNAIAYLMIVVTYIFMSFLQAMTIMFRLQTVQSTRRNEVSVLMQIGFQKQQCTKVICRESILFYVFVGFTTLLYMVNIFLALIHQEIVTVSFGIAMCMVLVVSLCIAWVISYLYYKRVIRNVE